jgi:tetratricopeptide (TPR) repeat protein
MHSPMRISCHAFLLLAAVAFVYVNALPAAFQFDDFNVIVDNPAVHSWNAWLASMPGIRPLLKLSYTFNWSMGWGTVGFHAFNIVVHGFNVLLVHALVCRLCRLHLAEHAEYAALLAALLFALHPAQTEAVTYISGRSVSLMACFYLSGMLLWLHGRRGCAALMLLAALMVKETAWTLPFALLLWQRAEGKSLRESARELLPLWLVLAAAMLAMLAMPAYQRLLAGSLSVRGLGENLTAQVEGQFYLLTQPLLMLHANIDPDIAVPEQLGLAWLLKVIVLSGLVGWGVHAMRKRPWLGLGILWFFLHLLPTNSLLPRSDIANDRQLYLALIGPALLLVIVLVRSVPARIAVSAGFALVLLQGAATISRNEDYRTEVSLWRATAEASPNKARVWNNLGYAYRLAGNLSEAHSAYWRALEIDRNDIQARANLMALDRMGESIPIQ